MVKTINKIKYSYCSSSFDEGAIETEYTAKNLQELHDFLLGVCESQPQTINKAQLARFIPSTFNHGNARRTVEDFIETDLMVLDIDEETEENFNNFILSHAEAGTGFFYFETPSSSPEKRKYRLVFKLSEPIKTVEKFKVTYRKLFNNKIVFDVSCNDVARFFYIPNETKASTFVLFEGGALVVPEITEAEITNEKQKANNQKTEVDDDVSGFFLESAEVVEHKLKFILNWMREKNVSITKTYPEWLSICFACVSLKKHNLAKETCFKYFYTFSKLDGDKCAGKEDVLKQFEICWSDTHDKITIATIYGMSKKAGCPMPPINPQIIKMVKAEEKGSYYLALNNEDSDDIVPLNRTIDSANVAREKILLDSAEKFSIKHNEIRHADEDGKFKFSQSISGFIAKFESQPIRICYLLGNTKKGKFFEKSTDSLLIADHYRVPCKAVFHSAIDLWIKQLNMDTSWLYTYLFYLTQMDVALPMIHCWGVRNACKSTFINMIGSVWSNPPILDYFTDGSNFKNTAGSSPIIFFDEFVPNKPNEIKSMITSNMISVNQKYKSAMYIRGYPRLASAVNEEKFKFPGGSGNSDQGAIYRRVQDIEFTDENRVYAENLGGIDVIKTWLNGAFREHVKYVQENPDKFNIKKPGKDILVLSPEHKDTNHTTFNSRHQAILEFFYGTECRITKENERQKEININVKNFFEALIKNRYLSERGSDSDMVSLLRRPFGKDGKLFRRDKDLQGESRWRLDRKKVIEIQKQLDLHIEESSKTENEENF